MQWYRYQRLESKKESTSALGGYTDSVFEAVLFDGARLHPFRPGLQQDFWIGNLATQIVDTVDTYIYITSGRNATSRCAFWLIGIYW
jgi:hypothetical protein